MTTRIDGTLGIVFPDGTVQATAAQTGVGSFSTGATGLTNSGSATAVVLDGVLSVPHGGTGTTTSTGTGANVLADGATLNNPTFTGVPTSIVLTNGTGLPLTTGVTGILPIANGGTGTTTSTGTGALVLSNSPTLVTPNLGTPSAVTLSNATGLPLTTGVTGVLPVLNGGTGTTTSTGTGSLVLSTSPTLVTPNIGTPSVAVLTNATGLPLTTGVTGTLPIANGGTASTTAVGALVSLGAITSATGSQIVPAGTTAQRDLAPVVGGFRFNTTLSTWEGFNGTVWSSVGAGAGSVSSVDATVPAFLSVTGGPITSAGTLAFSLSGLALPISSGGTGAVTASAARTSLGVAASGINNDITQLTALSTALSVSQGGTGATTSTGTAGSVVLSISPTLVTPNLGTPSTVVLTNATGLPLSTGVTGVLPVVNGGSGVASITGLVKGTGTTPFTAAVAGTDYVAPSVLGAANGVATLDASGKLLTTQLPSSVVGALNYQGGWNASTNTPALASGVGTKGYYYVVTVAGSTVIDGSGAWTVGDWAVFNGSTWDQVQGNASDVVSVNGLTGVVSITAASLGAATGGANSNITSLSGLTTALSINQGGTGSTTATGAITNLLPAQSVGTNGQVLTSNGTTAAWATPTVSAASITGVIGTANGGTGLSTFTSGGAVYATSSSTLTSGTLPVSAGGTGGTTTTTAQIGLGIITSATGGMILPVGTTAQRDATPTTGEIRFNSTTSLWEGYNGSSWASLASGGGGGTVTSVDVTVPSFLAVTGGPVTTSGTIALSYSGTALPIANGGTGATTAAGARTSLGVAASGVNGDITQLTALSTALSTSQGGTGLTSFTSGGAIYATSTNALTSGTLPVTAGGTGTTTSTGTGSVVLSNSPTLVTPNLGTPSVAVLTNATGLPLTTGVTGILPIANGGTGTSTSTGTGNLVLSTSPVLTTPNLGTPSVAVLTNATGLPLSTGVTGVLPVANGGTGDSTLSGILKGAGTSPVVTATAGTDYVAPTVATVFTAKQTFSATSTSLGAVIGAAAEPTNVTGAVLGSSVNLYLSSGSVLMSNVAQTSNWSLNVAHSSGTTLNSVMAVGEAVTVVVLALQGSTAYYHTSMTVDGSAVTPYWAGSSAPTAGNANGYDSYTFTIIKTAASTFTVLASLTDY
jgi:hypothetical protein